MSPRPWRLTRQKSRPKNRFRAVSYNIHRCVGMDGRKDPGRIAEVLRELGADIVGLQEVDSKPGEDSRFELTRELAKTTGFPVTPGVTILHDDKHYGNVLLTGRRVSEVRRLDLSGGVPPWSISGSTS